MKRRFFLLLAIFCCLPLFSQNGQEKSAFDAALFYFRANKPNDAIELFEKALENPDVNPSAYVYLGVSYFQIGQYQKSLDVCKKGLEVSGTDKKILSFNAGNASFALKGYVGAEEYFRKSLKEDANYAPAVLNLANTLVEEGKLSEAIGFYEKFLTIAQGDKQVEKVREIIEKLKIELERNKGNEPELIPIDEVEYLNRLDAEEAARKNQKIALEKLGEEYYLKSKDDGLYIVKSEKYIDDYDGSSYSEETEYKVIEGEIFVVDDEFSVIKVENEKVTFETSLGEKIDPNDLDKLEDVKIESADVTVTDEKGETLEMKIEDDELIVGPEIEMYELPRPEPPVPPEPVAPPEPPKAPKISLSVTDEFTPDGDGENDVAKIKVRPKNTDPADIASWEVLILDVKGGVLKTFSGGSEIPDVVEFDGKCDGELELDSATDYPVHVKVTLKDSTVIEANSILSTGILIIKDGDKYKIKVPNINFDPNQATMDDLTDEQLASNEKILTMVAFALKKFQEYKVTVEGHANNTTGTEEEEKKELIPLSRARAKAVMNILIEKGIERERLSAVGMGGKKPIATGAESYKNRRVEFILEK